MEIRSAINADAETKNVAAEKGLNVFEDEFLQGQWDCMNGKPHRDGMSEAYDRGYSAQYQLEQINNAISQQQNRLIQQ